jgi:hypothetical protein
MLLRMGKVVRVEMARDTTWRAWPRTLGWQVSFKSVSFSPPGKLDLRKRFRHLHRRAVVVVDGELGAGSSW